MEEGRGIEGQQGRSEPEMGQKRIGTSVCPETRRKSVDLSRWQDTIQLSIQARFDQGDSGLDLTGGLGVNPLAHNANPPSLLEISTLGVG